MIFAPSRFLGKTYEIRTGDMVMVAYLAPPHPGEEAFSVIRVGLSLVAKAVGFLVVDPVQCVSRVQDIPGGGFIGVERVLRRDPLADEGERVGLVADYAG